MWCTVKNYKDMVPGLPFLKSILVQSINLSLNYINIRGEEISGEGGVITRV